MCPVNKYHEKIIEEQASRIKELEAVIETANTFYSGKLERFGMYAIIGSDGRPAVRYEKEDKGSWTLASKSIPIEAMYKALWLEHEALTKKSHRAEERFKENENSLIRAQEEQIAVMEQSIRILERKCDVCQSRNE